MVLPAIEGICRMEQVHLVARAAIIWDHEMAGWLAKTTILVFWG